MTPSPALKPITAAQFRRNINRTLDQVLETGVLREIQHRGELLLLTVDPSSDTTENQEGSTGNLE